MFAGSCFARRPLLWLIAALALSAASCSGRKKVYPVRGEVFNGEDKPATGAVVAFHPIKSDSSAPIVPVGTVDKNGKFTLTTYTKDDGAPVGEYLITIVWPTPRESALDTAGGDQLEGRYTDPDKSEFRFTVESKQDNSVPSIVVK